MHVQIASPEFSDWIGLLALLRDSFGYMEGRIDPPSSLASMTEHDLKAKACRECLIVACDAGQLIGCAYAQVRADCVYVGKVAVAARQRGRGIARQMMAVAEQVAISVGHQVLELQTRVELLENHRAFAALGFEKVAETAHRGYTRPTSITMRRRVVPERDPRWDC